jgi:hypothetical protein
MSINTTNPMNTPPLILVDRRTFGSVMATIPGAIAATALPASDAYWTGTTVTATSMGATAAGGFDITFQKGRPGKTILFHASTANPEIQVQGGDIIQFENIGDELVIEDEIMFGTGFQDDLGFFIGVATSDTTVFNDTPASLPTNKVGFHKTKTGTTVAFLVNGTSIPIPGVVLDAGNRWFFRAVVTKTDPSATSAKVQVQVYKNWRASGVYDGYFENTADVTTLPAVTSAPVRHTRAFAGNATTSITFHLFGDALRFTSAY